MRFFSFETQAQTYQHSAIAQRVFIQKLLSRLPKGHYKLIAELGCGGGELFLQLEKKQIGFEKFVACDSSSAMLERFELCEGVELFCKDFDEFLISLDKKCDLLLSSSALQWSHSLSNTLSLIAKKSKFVALSIMSASSLKSLHSFLGTSSPLLEGEEIERLLRSYFEGEIYYSRVELRFGTIGEGVNHLRQSGVLGGGILNFQKAKKMLNFDGKFEYESINILGKPK